MIDIFTAASVPSPAQGLKKGNSTTASGESYNCSYSLSSTSYEIPMPHRFNRRFGIQIRQGMCHNNKTSCSLRRSARMSLDHLAGQATPRCDPPPEAADMSCQSFDFRISELRLGLSAAWVQ
jgi:hypothetical protein